MKKTVFFLMIAIVVHSQVSFAVDLRNDPPVLMQAPSGPYEVLETYEWTGKPADLDAVLFGMIEKTKKTVRADALLLKEVERGEDQKVTRVLGRAIRYSVGFQESTMCRNCHARIYEQHSASMHSRSASNPVFLAQYFKEVLPRLSGEPELIPEADRCTACHNPIEYLTRSRYMTAQTTWEVTCDFCHTLRGHSNSVPGNGDYLSLPGDRKAGPFRKQSWHTEYSSFVRSSEFCGTCHNGTNHNGLAVKTTYDEWKASAYSRDKVQCQNCHMNREGYLVEGKATYERGRVVSAAMQTGLTARRRVYDHRFPGAHTEKQIDGSLGVSIATDTVGYVPGRFATARITIDNGRAGHRMPTGSADLRVLWLEVRAFVNDTEAPVECPGEGDAAYGVVSPDVGGLQISDAIPRGSRVYRTLFVNGAGKVTLSSYDAVSVLYDNRLNAGEVRVETCHVSVPPDATGPVTITASLKYLRYPATFATKLDLPVLQPHEIAAAAGEIPARAREQGDK